MLAEVRDPEPTHIQEADPELYPMGLIGLRKRDAVVVFPRQAK